LKRVHGGAVSTESRLEEPQFDDKTSLASREKGLIADYAVTLINDGDTVYLDGGSTVLQLARLLVNRDNITVVTNSLRAAFELSGRGPRLILIGGELRRLSETMVGTLTPGLLDQLNFDIAFMGTMAFSVEQGLTTSDPAEAFTKRMAMKRARKSVLLCDSGKLGQTSFAHAGQTSDVHVLVTDKRIKPDIVRSLRKLNVKVVTV
jgi:DeoR family transcriptional regulator, fructose operon transcriptional repressor